MGHQPEDMFYSCLFRSKLCSTTDFTVFRDPLFGFCFSINSGRSRDNFRNVTHPNIVLKQSINTGYVHGKMCMKESCIFFVLIEANMSFYTRFVLFVYMVS